MQKQKDKNAVLTREQWLQNAIVRMTSHFKKHNYVIPKVRVSRGWPGSSRGKAIGECWDKSAASDKVAQIFISPRLKSEKDECGVLATLVHEVCHAVVGNDAKHGKVFGACARAVGLEGKLTATHAGAELKEKMTGWLDAMGPYPHASINPGLGRPKAKQTTRMLKCECEACGYVARVSAKWLEEVGAPLCPCNSAAMKFELPDDSGEDEEED